MFISEHKSEQMKSVPNAHGTELAGGQDRERLVGVHNDLDDGGGSAGQHVQRRDRHRLLVLRGARRRAAGHEPARALAGAARHAGLAPLRQLGD